LLSDKDLKAVVRIWREGLVATKSFWNPAAKEWVTEPDWGRRYDFSMAIAAYVEGKPIERSMEVTGSYKELSVLLEELKQSPEAMRLLPRELFDSLLSNTEGQESAPAREAKPPEDSEQKTG
jgi:hypothetical protein